MRSRYGMQPRVPDLRWQPPPCPIPRRSYQAVHRSSFAVFGVTPVGAGVHIVQFRVKDTGQT